MDNERLKFLKAPQTADLAQKANVKTTIYH